jgi:hypothetical protein
MTERTAVGGRTRGIAPQPRVKPRQMLAERNAWASKDLNTLPAAPIMLWSRTDSTGFEAGRLAGNLLAGVKA